MANELLANLEKLHTTELGIVRIKRNICLGTDDVVSWCKKAINSENCKIIRQGKNWYATINDCVITINAHSYTIITAHNTNFLKFADCDDD